MKNIIVVATLTLKASQSENVLEALKALYQATHKEDKGYLQYDIHKDTEQENTYVFIETWESEALLAEHLEKEHYHAYIAFMRDKIERKSIQKLEKIL